MGAATQAPPCRSSTLVHPGACRPLTASGWEAGPGKIAHPCPGRSWLPLPTLKAERGGSPTHLAHGPGKSVGPVTPGLAAHPTSWKLLDSSGQGSTVQAKEKCGPWGLLEARFGGGGGGCPCLLTDPALSCPEGSQWQRCPGSFSGGSLTAASACGPGSVISDLSTLHGAVPTATGTPCLETQECGWNPRLKAVGNQSDLPSFPGVVQWRSRTSGLARVSQPLPLPLICSAGEPDVFDRPHTKRKERGQRCGPCTQPVGTPGSLYSLRRALGGCAGFSPTTGPGSWGHWGRLLSSAHLTLEPARWGSG